MQCRAVFPNDYLRERLDMLLGESTDFTQIPPIRWNNMLRPACPPPTGITSEPSLCQFLADHGQRAPLAEGGQQEIR